MSSSPVPKLLIATNNQGKLWEYRYLLRDLPCRLVSLAGEGVAEVNAEAGSTFEENAVLKAQGYARSCGLLTVADDSGLEVDALGGRPGVLSARYGGETTDEGRVRRLLRELEGVPWERRTARFVCVIAVQGYGVGTPVFRGECLGAIGLEPRGDKGFGYDPVFFLPGLGRTMAELSFEEKNRVSHRAKAAARALPALLENCRGRPD